MAPAKDTLRPTDDAARRLAKTLVRTARYAALACLDPETGTPLASRIGLATLPDGTPVFLISQLSSHFAALEADARASILVGEPGKGDALAHARMTLVGRAEKLSGLDRDHARARYLSRHPKAGLYADFADFAFWRLTMANASLNGGFGKAFALDAPDLIAPEIDGLQDAEAGMLEHMNSDHADAVENYARSLGASAGKWRLCGIDAEGLDLMLGDETRRLWFDEPLRRLDAVRPTLVALAKATRA